MDDSDQDFIDLCSKPLKRVRKKPTEGRNRPKAEQKSGSQAGSREKRKANLRDDLTSSGSKCAGAQTAQSGLVVAQEVYCLGAGGDAAGTQKVERPVRAKDKVLQRMQQFKRESPQKMVLTVQTASAMTEKKEFVAFSTVVNGKQASLSPDLHTLPKDSDEALALRMQQDLDREAAQAQMVDLEDGGLFFCHICGRDLTHMTPGGRSLHVNRCLDESEESAPPLPSPPPPPPPAATGVPDCPICGKRFKSQKSRSAHLKRCSSDMGVAPAELLQAVQRQAEESQSVSAAGRLVEAGGTKRKSSKTTQQARKKPRQTEEPLDEETMVALALSSSLLQQQKEVEQRVTQMEVISAAPDLKWKLDAGKGRGKKKKGAATRPPPPLLIQDAEAALARLQERVSALLLRRRPPSPPTPTRSPSRLPGWIGNSPLWHKSSLLEGATMRLSEFYTPELADFITPWESKTDAAQTPSSAAKLDSLVPTAIEETSVPKVGISTLSTVTSSHTAASSHSAPPTPQSGHINQTEEVNQHSCTASFHDKAGVTLDLRLSGFIQEDSDEQVDLQASGFLPWTHTHSDHHPPRARRSREEPQQSSVALSRLSTDLSSMVNNPQLSDLQLQVDDGNVYFAHSFMVYARCPLLAEMVHESGFGVREDGMPTAQRVLLSDVPGQAVLVLLQYLYTAQCSVPASLQPHVLELSSRFDLKELQELCKLHPAGGDEEWELSQEDTDQAFVALLRSMWNEGDVDEDRAETEERAATEEEAPEEETVEGSGMELAAEEKVNEEELEEIYEFAATQRKKDGIDDKEEEEDRSDKGAEPQPDRSLDGYSRLFSTSWGTFEEESATSVSTSQPEPPLVTKHPPKSTSAARSTRPADSALLQSSSSVLNEPSLSPPCNLPFPGRSPGQEGSGQWAEPAKEPPAPLSVCPPPDMKDEPELIVLSDSSSEEAEEVVVDEEVREEVVQIRSPSSSSPTCPSYTHIKPQLPPPESDVSPDMAGCSPEVSWLLPSTPPQQQGRTSASGSSQNRSSRSSRSSGCRTQLFPSQPAPPVFSSPDLQALTSPLPVQVTSSILTPGVAPPNSSCTSHLVREALAGTFNQSRRSPSTNTEDLDTPLRPHLQPCSSTPLLRSEHREAPPPPLPPAASPLCNTSISQQQTGSDGSEVAEQRSFHLSPLSNCSSSHGAALSGRNTGSESVKEEEGRAEEEAESSFHQSFLMMDEPPMAFNDSWGLDGGGGDDQGGFSLRLEDSGGSSRPQEAASSSSSSSVLRQAPPPGFCSPSTSPSRTSHSSGNAAAATPTDYIQATPPAIGSSLLDSKLWDSWREEQEEPVELEEEEEEEEEALPLTQRVNPAAELRTPTAQSSTRRRRHRSLVPITPMPHYSDMDTPELKNKLDKFGVRPLPKRQMILKLREIHQYTHTLANSDSEDEDRRPPTKVAPFKEPRAPPVTCPGKSNVAGKEAEQAPEDAEPLSASQGSSTSSVAASEESERSNPEVGPSFSSDGDSDDDVGVSASQTATRLQDRLQAVRDFILSDSELYSQILRYRPLVLSTFQARLKAAGIRLGTAKLADYLDSQCITFTTAKPGQAAAGRRKAGRKAVTAGRSRKAGAAAVN